MRAMVLCAGYGTRLGDLTRLTPKPMLLLEGRPLLEYIIVHLGRHGFREIAVNLHFMPGLIRDYFGDGSRWGVKIHYSVEEALLGTAGALRAMDGFLGQEDAFLVHYGDVLTDQDFTVMMECHRKKKAVMTMLVHQRHGSNSIVSMDGQGRVVHFMERPVVSERPPDGSPWVNSGVSICGPEMLDAIDPGWDAPDIPRDVVPRLVPRGKVYGFPLTSYRCAIDSPARLAEARAAVKEGRYATVLPGEHSR
jgi:NDP-sugar pyrophosphorylase family protein